VGTILIILSPGEDSQLFVVFCEEF